MSIRVFLNQWKETPAGNNVQVSDPIDDYLNNVSVSDPNIFSVNFYARAAQNGRPDKVYLIKVIRANLLQTEWDALGALPKVIAVPPASLNDPVSGVKTNVKNKIYTALDSLGIPRTTFDSAPTIGAFLHNILGELNGGNFNFGALENNPAEWA